MSLSAQAQIARVVNAASLVSNTALAPGSIITIFGANLASGQAIAISASNPPSSLGGASLTVGGAAADFFYVSPTQINAVLSPATPVGTQTLTLTSSTGTFSTNVSISTSAPPGIFSLFGTGTHDGAILNALTFALGAFSITTGKNSTFLAIYATGLDLSTKPVVTIGGVSVTVQFFGAAPCCMGLQQINVMLPQSLNGAGRVEVVVQSGGQSSNAVEVVLLPAQGQGESSDDQDNQTRSRELAGIAYIPGTSLALLTDENDDVVRVVDVAQRKVTQVIGLPDGAEPVAAAVNAGGTLAVVAERGIGKVAILDLTHYAVVAQVAVGLGPVSVAIAGNIAVVVNGDADTVSLVNLTNQTASSPIAVGNGPRGVTIDATGTIAYVTNEDAGTVSVINLAGAIVSNTITLGPSIRPTAIQLIPGSTYAAVTVPSASNTGEVLILNLTTGTFATINANPDRSGGSSDIAVNGTTVYFANQTGGSVSFVPVSTSTGQPTASPTSIPVGLGARALAIDTKDNLLLVTNEATGTIALVDLNTGKVVAHIDAVRSDSEGDDSGDDHSDHDNAPNVPVIASLSPATTKSTATFTLTITGTNLSGATKLIFVNPANIHGNGKGKGDSPISAADSAFVTSNIQVTSGGTQLTANLTVTSAAPGPRVVIVETPNGNSSLKVSMADTLTVIP